MAIYPDPDRTSYPSFPAEIVNERIKEVLYSEHPLMDQIISYMTRLNGKMIRPRLVFLSASLRDYDFHTVLDMAVAVELIHMASLVHDDVIDHANTRRGQESVNRLWGNQTAVLMGDYLFAAAFALINRYGKGEILGNITDTIRTMCIGEISQMNLAYQLDISEEDYFSKTYGKTACLIASACKVGALSSSLASEQVYRLEQFGLCLGYAYQIIDDLLDYCADPDRLDKPVGVDWLEGNTTLPLLYLVKHNDYRVWVESIFHRRQLTAHQWQRLVQALYDSGAVQSCINCAGEYLNRAYDHLDYLPGCVAVQEIKLLANSLVNDYFPRLCTKAPLQGIKEKA